jgi:hypothetical protein
MDDLGGGLAMNIIKFILVFLGLIFGAVVVFWLLGVVWSLLWYVFWLALIGAAGYGVYNLFKRAENKLLGGSKTGYIDSPDTNMSWEEYDQKYLHK